MAVPTYRTYTTPHPLQPDREPGLKINVAKANPQSTSPIFRLPAEIRQLIYEYVIGTGTIHVKLRPCEPHDNPVHESRVNPVHESRIHNKTAYAYKKFHYSTCRHTILAFPQRYALSKKSSDDIPVMYYNGVRELPLKPPPALEGIILPNWDTEHYACWWKSFEDMTQGQFASVSSRCPTLAPHDWSAYQECKSLRKLLELRHGLPGLGGSKKSHADSAVHVDGLLRSCRAIYGEARTLPFQLYTFDLEDKSLDNMLSKWLHPFQASAIERLHVVCDNWESFMTADVHDLVEEFLPKLKKLEVDIFAHDIYNDLFPVGCGDDWRWLRGARQGKIGVKDVEVVVAFDHRWEVERGARRVVAEGVEGVLRDGVEIWMTEMIDLERWIDDDDD